MASGRIIHEPSVTSLIVANRGEDCNGRAVNVCYTQTMKTLILYTTKHGFTQQCVEYLAQQLPQGVTAVDIGKDTDVDVAKFDQVIMGGSVYMMKMSRQLKQFARQNAAVLAQKQLALFVCCMTPDSADSFMQECFPQEVYEAAKLRVNFGGALNAEKLNLLERTVTGVATAGRSDKAQGVLWENVDAVVALMSVE